MPALPVISGAECVAALGKVGYHVLRQKGSRSILRTADVGVDEFVALLK